MVQFLCCLKEKSEFWRNVLVCLHRKCDYLHEVKSQDQMHPFECFKPKKLRKKREG